jgi:UDP-N-acetylglucosamine 2-epimerase (non-hydrolysing)
MKIKVMSVFGTRPEAIKMMPVVKKLREYENIESVVCVTAQHREMLDQILHTFGVVPDYDLNLMRPRQTLEGITANTLLKLGEVLREARPDLVLVHGDTTTSFSAALSAFYEKIPVGHVEAGLRTFDRYSPFPEEINRVLTARLADLHFAPTELNAGNLRRENVAGNIYVTGNTVIDALFQIVRDDYVFEDKTLRGLDYDSYKTILLTAHRRENLGAPMLDIFRAVLDLADANPAFQVIYPVHLNPLVREPAEKILSGHPRIHLIDPIGVSDMHNLFAKCHMVMTDSGGLQEEAPALGKPVLVLRSETERPEAVAAGTVKVVGVKYGDILREATLLISDTDAYAKMAEAANPYGDGHASERICDAIISYFKEKNPHA